MTNHSTSIEMPWMAYQVSHPWIKFNLDLREIPYEFWMFLGECRSKCDHLAGVPLQPETARQFYSVYLSKGVHGTTAIEGNTLTEQEVRERIEGKLQLPPSREYLQKEVDNIIEACNSIADGIYGVGDLKLSRERIAEFNKMVLNGLEVKDGRAGEVSTVDVGVGGYRGAPRKDCDYLLQRLCEWINGGDFEIREPLGIGMAIIKAMVAHVYFEWIHPYPDGNGRTGRLIEFHILNSHGVPAPASHLLSNFYNQTRTEYYKQLEYASASGGDLTRFLLYAVRGFRDGLREQIDRIRDQQLKVTWINYVHRKFEGHDNTPSGRRRRHLVLAISACDQPVSIQDATVLNGKVASLYRGVKEWTIQRDVNEIVEMGLVVRTGNHLVPNIAVVEQWLAKRVSI